jgi:hypothetical protein
MVPREPDELTGVGWRMLRRTTLRFLHQNNVVARGILPRRSSGAHGGSLLLAMATPLLQDLEMVCGESQGFSGFKIDRGGSPRGPCCPPMLQL